MGKPRDSAFAPTNHSWRVWNQHGISITKDARTVRTNKPASFGTAPFDDNNKSNSLNLEKEF
jgi:hypothetical protein